jgi:TatA/E family protein of Tat protein translocase
MPLLFLEFLGTTELLVIMVVALVLFGPRKLPKIGHSIGKSLSEFKRASEDFKRTWEAEVNIEESTKQARIENTILPDGPATPVYARGSHDGLADEDGIPASGSSSAPGATAADETTDRSLSSTPATIETTAEASVVAPAGAAPRKQDWL